MYLLRRGPLHTHIHTAKVGTSWLRSTFLVTIFLPGCTPISMHSFNLNMYINLCFIFQELEPMVSPT